MKSRIAIATVLSTLAILTPISSLAEPHWRGDMRHFHQHDIHRWATGHWIHGRHDGRIGWWWVVGAATGAAIWYSYANPVYPYPDPYAPPATVVVETPPAAPPVTSQAEQVPAQPANWYYCESRHSYYPYVPTCPEPWKVVPATPAGQ